MSRDLYGSVSQAQRSPRPSRRSEMAVSLGQGSPSKTYMTSSISQPPSARGSPISRNISSPSQQPRNPRGSRHYGISRSSNSSPLTLPAEAHVPHSISSSAFNVTHYYNDADLGSPVMDPRGSHRSRSTSRTPLRSYHSLERDQDREFMPIREPRERSLDRVDMSARHVRSRDRSLDPTAYRDHRDIIVDRDPGYRDRETIIDSDPYRDTHMHRSTHTSNADPRHNYSRDSFVMELQSRLNELQNQYGSVKRELDATTQKLGSSMHSIKTFWSPELKKERALRKEEAAKYALINDQLKILRSENQKQATLIRQLEEELRLAHIRNPDTEIQQHLEALYTEKDHMSKEIYLLRETIKELELRIETQKQTLAARDESIKKLMEMMQNKGVGGKLTEEERMETERLRSRLIEVEARSRHLEGMLEARDKDLTKLRAVIDGSDTNGFGTLESILHGSNKQRYDGSSNNNNNTLEAIVEIKEARIATLEGEVELLEKEIYQLRESSCSSLESNCSCNQNKQGNHDTSKWEKEKHPEHGHKEKLEELRIELNKRDQEILAMGAKMKTLEEQHQDYQRHIAVLKESLCAKEEHYNMLQADVEELRQRLEEKNKMIEKKTQQAMTATQERNRLSQEVQELRDHMEIKDRKINVLQRKIENLEDLLKEKDNQVDMARARLTAMQAHHSSSEGALSSLEEAISDKDKQITQLREQRDRAEQERNEERELHEREIAEYKMKMHGMESEMEKLQNDIQSLRSQLQKQGGGKDITAQQNAELAALRKQLDDKQRSLEDLEKKLKKRKEKLDMMESSLQQAEAGQNEVLARQISELRQKVAEYEHESAKLHKELESAKENSNRSQSELERLLQIMSSTEDEKFMLNKQIKELQDSLREKEAKLNSLKRNQQADKARSAQMLEEARHREGEAGKDASKAQEQVRQQQERIEELEEALRESVRITAEREIAVAQRDSFIKAAEDKIAKLAAESRALQNGINARCTNCPAFKLRLADVEKKLTKLLTERKTHLKEMFEMKQEALSAAISEKDAHLALLEMSGVKNAQTAEEVDRLKVERRRLMERLKTENETRVKLMAELGESVQESNDNKVATQEQNGGKEAEDAEDDGLRT